MKILNSSAIDDFTSNLLEQGIAKTAASFEMFINSNVHYHYSEENIVGTDLTGTITNLEDKILLLKTELIGGLTGINYLVLSKSMATTISNHMFDGVQDTTSSREIVEFLKEMENVLAASTITTISDVLDMDLYGDVPKIQAASVTQLNDIVHQETSNISPELGVAATLDIPELGISPTLYWFFNRSFTPVIQELKSA
ncbi:MAG: hypothetical protein HRT61_23260 [Ekhidna sp.]|nr:hypothetical protein [Ekhidna sp.]